MKSIKQKKNAVRSAEVLGWEDDPQSGAKPVKRPAPKLATAPLELGIKGSAPEAKLYKPGTSKFRYWAAADGLRRGADFWGSLMPKGTTWQPGKKLTANLDEGEDLNAYYDREGLSFFHYTIGKSTVYSGESPDVLCHELGHAVLDAIRPELWDTMSAEVAAFHESWGDMSAILSALQLKSVRQAVLTETSSRFYRTSRVSRLAEQLGWAIRQMRPELVEPDCLRNAVNAFFYKSPLTLPPSGPSATLSSEPHSFSRVFTGAFFEALASMLRSVSKDPSEEELLQVSTDMGTLLVDAIAHAAIVPEYFSQVAAHIIEADAHLFKGQYRDSVKGAFSRRGILSLDAATSAGVSRDRRRKGLIDETVQPSIIHISIDGADYGLGEQSLWVQAPSQVKRFDASPASLDHGSLQTPSSENTARAFVEYLIRRGRVKTDEHGDTELRIVQPEIHKTHKLIKREDRLALVRITFDCGFD
jgi:hypothetical protein